jgi:hypothetical protein
MSYIIEREQHGRNERSVDVERFTADLAKALGGTVIPRDQYPDRYAEFSLDDTVVTVSRGWAHREFDKVTIGIEAADVRFTYNDRPSGADYRTPKATVSVTRPLARIVADVKRRVIEPAKAPLAKLRDHAAMVAKRTSDLAATAERLRRDYPGLDVSIKNGSSYSGTLYRNRDGAPYLSGNFNADGSVNIERLGSLTADQFERLMRALYQEKTA